MVNTGIEKLKRLDHAILVALLILIGLFYIYLATLPKHSDFYVINYISKSFATYGFRFLDVLVPIKHNDIAYPPTYYILQGCWIKLGSLMSIYDLNTWSTGRSGAPGVYPLWGMVTNLAGLFSFTALSYFTLKNKWLSLVCFGTFTFVSVIVMGQIDIFGALFVYVSMLLMLKASNSEKYLYLIFFGVISLGISTQFKTYGGILLPLYLIYAFTILKRKNVPEMKAYGAIAMMAFAFVCTFFVVWIPFARWFGIILLSGESNWLFNLQISPLGLPQYHNISIWLLGYAIIIYDSLRNALKARLNDRHFIFYGFAIVAWFFATVYTHPQWWVLLLPFILLVLDNFRNKINYLLCLSLLALYLFYPMMWINNIDKIMVNYIPVVPAFGQYATILATSIVALLIIWIFEIMTELQGPPPEHEKRSRLDSTAPILMLAIPFFMVFIIAIPIILSVGATGAKNVAYDAASVPIHGDITVGQSFTSSRDDLEGVNIRFACNSSPSDNLIFHLKRDALSPDLATVTIDPATIHDKQYTKVTFPDIANSKDVRYYFFVESPNASTEDAVSVLYENKDVYGDGTAYMNGSPVDGDLSFEALHKSSLSDLFSIYY